MMNTGRLIGTPFAMLMSASTILGFGIGSPTGEVVDSYNHECAWMIGIPATIFVAGLIWLIGLSLFSEASPKIRK